MEIYVREAAPGGPGLEKDESFLNFCAASLKLSLKKVVGQLISCHLGDGIFFEVLKLGFGECIRCIPKWWWCFKHLCSEGWWDPSQKVVCELHDQGNCRFFFASEMVRRNDLQSWLRDENSHCIFCTTICDMLDWQDEVCVTYCSGNKSSGMTWGLPKPWFTEGSQNLYSLFFLWREACLNLHYPQGPRNEGEAEFPKTFLETPTWRIISGLSH